MTGPVATSGPVSPRVGRRHREWGIWRTGGGRLDVRPVVAKMPAHSQSPFADGRDRDAPFPREILRLATLPLANKALFATPVDRDARLVCVHPGFANLGDWP
jgi:hypothetical protein